MALGVLSNRGIRPNLLLVDPSDGLLRQYTSLSADSLLMKAWEQSGLSPSTFTFSPHAEPELRRVCLDCETVFVEDLASLASRVMPSVPLTVLKPALRLLGYSTLIMSPIVAKDEFIGLLAIHQRGIDRSDLSAAELFARQIGDGVSRIRLIESLREKTRTIQEAQGRMVEARRLEAMGRLAGGIAHDFNNLLTVMMSTASLAKDTLHKDAQEQEDLSVLLDATKQAASLTRQLLDFANQRSSKIVTFNVHARLQSLKPLLLRSVGMGIELEINNSESLALVKADPSQFDQVLMNLASNAHDAMPDGGSLRISTVVCNSPQEISIAVSDTGSGMDEETLARVFEPFFSTKPRDKGTGLGLATCFGIISGLGGSIQVESVIGSGTTITLRLPQDVAPDLDEEGKVSPPSADLGPCVLLVEDHEQLRLQVEKTLVAAGYAVIAVDSAEAALQEYEARPSRFSLILTDLRLPGMQGTDLAEAILAQNSNMKILLMTGHEKAKTRELATHALPLAILWKPFTPDALLARLAERLAL